MIPKLELQRLARLWREKAKRIEEKFLAVNPAQTSLVIETLNTCSEELEEIVGKERE